MKAKPNKNPNRINRIARYTLLFFSMLLPVNLIAQSSDSSIIKTNEDKLIVGIFIAVVVLWIIRKIRRFFKRLNSSSDTVNEEPEQPRPKSRQEAISEQKDWYLRRIKWHTDSIATWNIQIADAKMYIEQAKTYRKQNPNAYQSNVAGYKSDIARIQANIANAKAEIARLKTEMRSLK
jgi:hypothetical protein